MSTKQERKEIYNTERWRALRNRILQKAGWLCTTCRAAGRTQAAIEVHHLQPIRTGGPPFDPVNLISLCRNCHDEAHGRYKPVNPSEEAWKAFRDELTGD